METLFQTVNLKTVFYQCTLEVEDLANVNQKPNSRLPYWNVRRTSAHDS